MKPFNDQPQVNRCAGCGRFVGNCSTGQSRDSWLKPGPEWCEPCIRKNLEPPFELASNEAALGRDIPTGYAPERREAA